MKVIRTVSLGFPVALLTMCLVFITLEARRATGDGDIPRSARFVPSNFCTRCHVDEYRTWRASDHAQAYETLTSHFENQGKELDPACLACHSTGYKQTGGFRSLEETPSLVDVGCCECHGRGSAHIDLMLPVQRRVQGAIDPGEHNRQIEKHPTRACFDCHNPHLKTPEETLAWIDPQDQFHYRGWAAGTDASIPRDAQRASSEARFVPMDECKKCHEDRVNDWGASRHATSFDRLVTASAATGGKADYTHDPKCLRCHTTGFDSPDRGGFQNAEQTPHQRGIWCSECHGAASEHVTLMNRVILGNARDPGAWKRKIDRTPIERNCSRCHNPHLSGPEHMERALALPAGE
ncbi:MAG: cytochrome c family protein [Planctomycetes bacterium]|nr:cytochrome c family protein [Planctomycetota bacterium]